MSASARIDVMADALSNLGRKMLAVAVLIVAAYVLFKLVLGFVMGLVWIAVAIVAVIGVVWAMRVL